MLVAGHGSRSERHEQRRVALSKETTASATRRRAQSNPMNFDWIEKMAGVQSPELKVQREASIQILITLDPGL